MEIDIKKIQKRISEIEENLTKIRKYSSVSDKEFWADERNIYTLKQLLLEAIEAAGSICLHLVVKKLKKGVERFGECFEELEKGGIINHSLYRELKSMIEFRNKLVHRYWEIDDKLVLKYAREDLEDFEKFINSIKKFLRIKI